MDKQGYGMTEAGPVLSMSLGFAKEPIPSKSGSCGTVVRNAELKVVHLETRLSLGYNQTGEICIRGQQIMKGSFFNFLLSSAHIFIFFGKYGAMKVLHSMENGLTRIAIHH